MIKPNSFIKSVTIEQSKDSKQGGECVMDMTAYLERDGEEQIEYFQMKHTNVHPDIHMTLGKIRTKIVGFADRYRFHINENQKRKSDIVLSQIEVLTLS